MSKRCTRCLERICELENRAPVGWLPFAWGPQSENPTHYYVTPEHDDLEDNPTVFALCDLSACVPRGDKVAAFAGDPDRSEE